MRGIENSIANHVPALQAGTRMIGTCSRGFTPGYHMAGFQPYIDGELAQFHDHFYRDAKNQLK